MGPRINLFAQEKDPSSQLASKSKVVIVHDPEATEAFKPRSQIVRAMVDQAITNLTSTATVSNAWRTVVNPNDVVGIKVYSLPGPLSGTRKEVVEAVALGLLSAGLPGSNIVIWDKRELDLKQAGFYELGRRLQVRVVSSAEAGYDYSAFYDSPIIGNLVWGDLDFGRDSDGMGRKSYVTRLASQELTKIINVSPLLNHNLAGVSGNLYSLSMGAADNTTRFEWDVDRLSQAVPEIYALPWLSDKVVISMTDALVCQYEGGERTLLHYSLTPNELWVSKDPVALDTLAMDEIVKQRQHFGHIVRKPDYRIYANAALLQLGVSETNEMQVIRLQSVP